MIQSMMFVPLVFLALQCKPANAADVTEFDAKPLNGVTVNSTSGKVNITATNDAKASVTVSKVSFNEEKCKLSIYKEKTTIFITSKREGIFTIADCEVNLDIKVPKSVGVDVSLGAGSLTVKGTEKTLVFNLGAGEMIADGKFERVDGKSGAGSVTIKGLTGGGSVKTGSGSIALTFANTKLLGEIGLLTGSGDATINFAKGTKIRTSFAAGVGDMVNEIGDTENAPFKVTMKSGAGGLKIKSY